MTELEDVVARAAAAVSGEEPVEAAVTTLLLRHYLRSGVAELREPLGLALAQALAFAGSDPTVAGRAAWLTLLVEATAVAEDDRLLPAVEQLVAALRAAWPAHTRIDDVAVSAEACLRAAEIVEPGGL